VNDPNFQHLFLPRKKSLKEQSRINQAQLALVFMIFSLIKNSKKTTTDVVALFGRKGNPFS
jgi:hypothetical protein